MEIFNFKISPAYQTSFGGQPPRVQTLQSTPTPPPILQSSTSPSLDTHPNPWIKKIAKYLKSPQIPKARKTEVAPRQVQHRLRRSPRKFRQNFCTQAEQHLVANHLFNLTHNFHIYNKQGGKETIDALLMGKDSDTWWKAVGNEIGILANGIDNRVRATKSIEFIRKEEVPTGRTVTYANFLCD